MAQPAGNSTDWNVPSKELPRNFLKLVELFTGLKELAAGQNVSISEEAVTQQGPHNRYLN